MNPASYQPQGGFALLLDFVSGVPDGVANVGIVYGLFDGGDAHSQPQSAKGGRISALEKDGLRCASFTTVFILIFFLSCR